MSELGLTKIIGDVRKLDYDIFKNESWNDNIHPYLENQRNTLRFYGMIGIFTR